MTASIEATKHVRVTWQAGAAGTKHFIVHRSRDGAPPVAIGSPKGDTREFIDDRVPGAGTYTYSIRAAMADGSLSPESNRAVVEYAR